MDIEVTLPSDQAGCIPGRNGRQSENRETRRDQKVLFPQHSSRAIIPMDYCVKDTSLKLLTTHLNILTSQRGEIREDEEDEEWWFD